MPPPNPRTSRTAQVETVLIVAQAATRSLRMPRAVRSRDPRSQFAEVVTRSYTREERAQLTAHDDEQPTTTREALDIACETQLATRLAQRGRSQLAIGTAVTCAAVGIALGILAFNHARAPSAAPGEHSVSTPNAAAQRSAVCAARSLAPTREPAPPALTYEATAAVTPDAPTPEIVIEWLATARYREALTGYRYLAQSDARTPAYAAAASVLERKLAQRCAQRAELGGVPCATAQP